MNDRSPSSRQLTASWSVATGVLMSAASIRQHLLHHGLRASAQDTPHCKRSMAASEWAYEHRALLADWQQVGFSDESRLSLWDHNNRISVSHYADQQCIPECVIERYSGRTLRFIGSGVQFRVMDDPNFKNFKVITIARDTSVKYYS